VQGAWLDEVREGLAAGLSQLVLLGAGFDARGLRMREIAERELPVFEIDTAEQLRRKRRALAGGGVALPSRIAHVDYDYNADDLETDVVAALEARGFRRGAGAVFVWEGVIGYVDQVAIDRSLRFMADAGGPGSRVVFTFAEGTFDPETAAERTGRLGFRSCEAIGGDALWRRYLSGEPHPSATMIIIGTAVV
jgi:methyltransferase (TIGR00027 family)